jgi:hypothetical protein
MPVIQMSPRPPDRTGLLVISGPIQIYAKLYSNFTNVNHITNTAGYIRKTEHRITTYWQLKTFILMKTGSNPVIYKSN